MISTPALLAFLLAAEPGAAEASVSVRLADGRPAARLAAVPFQLGPHGMEAGPLFLLGDDGKGLAPFPPHALYVGGGKESCPAFVSLRDGRALLPACAERLVRVVDVSGGRPVKDAEATCLSAESWQRLEGLDIGPGTPLGATGQGVVRSQAGPVVCRFVSPGTGAGAFVRLPEGAAPGSRPVVVAMAPGADMEGVLVDARGAAVAGRTVRISALPAASERPGAEPGPWLPVARVSSDERGRLRARSLTWPVRLSVDDPSSAPAFRTCDNPASPCTLLLPDTSELEATLLLEDQPLPEAKVSVVQFDSRDPESVSRRVGTSDAEGKVLVRGLSSALDRSRIEAEAPGGVFARRLLSEPISGRLSLGAWPLEAVAPATVLVVTAEGKPVPGARISDARSKRALGRADEKGALSVPVPARGGTAVRAEADGFLPASQPVAPPGPIRIVLSRKGRIVLTARTSDGRAVRQAALGVESLGSIQRETESAARDGDDLAFDVAPGEAHWILRAAGAEPLDLGTFSVEPGETRHLGAVELSVGATVEGRLLSRDSGQPLVNARVTAQPVREEEILDLLNERLPEARTGLDGVFRVTGLPAGRARLFFEAPGHAVKRLDVDALLEGTQVGPVFVDRGAPLEVRFRDASGAPVEGVRLRVRPGGLDGTLREAAYAAAEGGSVTIPLVAAGTWGLVAEAEGSSPRRRVTLDGTETSLDWSFAGTTVAGRLTLEGEPVADAVVTARTPQSGVRMIQLDRLTPEGLALEPLRMGDAPQIRTVPVDGEGRFRLDTVIEDDVIVFAAGPGWATQPVRLALPGRGEVRQDLALDERRLLVRVVDGDGNPAPASLVALVGDEATGLSQATADAEGRAVFFLNGSVPIRAVRASDLARRRGLAPLPQGVASEVTVVLGPPPGPAVVSVRDPEGRPAPQAAVCAIGEADGTVRRARSDLHGSVRFTDLEEGAYRVVAEGRQAAFGTSALRVGPAGGAADLRLKPTGALVLRLDPDSAGLDPSRLRIEVLDTAGHDVAADAAALGRPARFRDDDRYVLPTLPEGTYRVRVLSGRSALADEPVRVSAGETKARLVAEKGGLK